MAIDTISHYIPKHQLPLYTRVVDPRHNDYTVGTKYDIRIEDRERQEEKGGKGPYNYTHEALLIAKRETVWSELEDMLIAFDAHTKSRPEAVDTICPKDEWEDERPVVVLVFLRLDAAKDWITQEGVEAVHPDMAYEAFEGNGQTTNTEERET